MLAGLSSEDQQGVSAITNHQVYQLCTYYTFLRDGAEHTNEMEIYLIQFSFVLTLACSETYSRHNSALKYRKTKIKH